MLELSASWSVNDGADEIDGEALIDGISEWELEVKASKLSELGLDIVLNIEDELNKSVTNADDQVSVDDELEVDDILDVHANVDIEDDSSDDSVDKVEISSDVEKDDSVLELNLDGLYSFEGLEADSCNDDNSEDPIDDPAEMMESELCDENGDISDTMLE